MQNAVTTAIRHIGVHLAVALMALMVVVCVGAGAAVATVVGGLPGPGLGGVAAVAAFQALRVPVGRASSWLIDG